MTFTSKPYRQHRRKSACKPWSRMRDEIAEAAWSCVGPAFALDSSRSNRGVWPADRFSVEPVPKYG